MSREAPSPSLVLRALGSLLGAVAWLWLKTLRLDVVDQAQSGDAAAPPPTSGPLALCFWHGTQFPLLAWRLAWRRHRATTVLVSHSRDGSLQARALALLGFVVVRGSSTRGGARGLAALVRVMKATAADAAFAVDGPRGPYGVVKEGALVAARATGAHLMPMGSAAARAFVFRRAWDKFVLPWPFTRIVVVLGAPIDPASGDATSLLEAGIRAANAQATALASSVPSGAAPLFAGPPARQLFGTPGPKLRP